MTRSTITVWVDKDDQEILRMKPDGQYYIPLSTVSAAELTELGAAIADALQQEVDKASKPHA